MTQTETDALVKETKQIREYESALESAQAASRPPASDEERNEIFADWLRRQSHSTERVQILHPTRTMNTVPDDWFARFEALVRENEQLKGIISDQREDSVLFSQGVAEGQRQVKVVALKQIERVRSAYARTERPTHEVAPLLELLRVWIEDIKVS